MSTKVETDNDSEQELIGLLVHAYNNHLAAITGFNELALLHNSQPKTEELLELSLKSSKEATYLGQTLLASISRLQLELEPIPVIKIANELNALYPLLKCELLSNDDCEITSHNEWLVDCFSEMIEFVNRLAIVKDKCSEPKISIKSDHNSNQIEVRISSSISKLEKRHQSKLFNSYYSSKKMFGTAGVGLAKVKGFLNQTSASVKWCDGEGFVVILPIAE